MQEAQVDLGDLRVLALGAMRVWRMMVNKSFRRIFKVLSSGRQWRVA
jgi:hypothetical protein